MNIVSIIVFSIVMLHLVAGFGWVMYKLRPVKKHTNEG